MLFSYSNKNNFLNDYHKEHFLFGFIGDPDGQLKALLNSWLLERVPMILIFDGVWSADIISVISCSLLEEVHHCFKK